MIIPELEQQKKAKEEKTKKRNKFLKLYIVPIFTIIFFILIIVGLVAPKITDVFAKLDEVSANNIIIADLNTRLNEVIALQANSETINTNLDTVNTIATSQNTEVIKFRDKISALTIVNNLTIVSQKLTESTVTPDGANSGLSGNVNLVEVPFQFEIVGRFEDIKSFIASLNTIDDFVIVKEMELALREQEGLTTDEEKLLNQWSLKINLVKYQFFEAKDLKSLYLSIPATSKISDDMKAYILLRQSKALDVTDSNGDLVTP
ncbi:MAG: hypothetical protein ABIM99_01315 [Candidatus Dojkabacteria bacterium]